MYKLDNREKLLKEIKHDNSREVLSSEISLMVLDKQLEKYPDKKEQIEAMISGITKKIDDLTLGLKIIEDEISKIVTEEFKEYNDELAKCKKE